MPTVYPLDEHSIVQAAKQTGKIITVEEHGLGGLGSAVAEVLALGGIPVKFRLLRLQREAMKVAGSQTVLRSSQGLSIERIVDEAISL
jgi:transketolase